MEGNLPSTEGNPIKAAHSNNGQSMLIIKATPRIEKLRTESLPMSPLSLNGNLTSVDVCDTSFGKKVFEDMKTTNAELPDESFSEEVLQDMDYSLDALRDAVPVLCLKKNDDSCDDADIFEEMSAYQVMGIYNNKDSQRRDHVRNRKGDNNSELKNKRPYADKNIDVLYQDRENEDNDKLECTKHPGKKIDEGEDEVNNLIKDNENDINNNVCPMEIKAIANGSDWIQNKDNLNLSENDAYNFNNYQDKGTLKDDCQMRESFGGEESNKSLCENKNKNVEVKDKTDNSSTVNHKDHVIENEVSNSCKREANKEQFNEELSKNNNQDSVLNNLVEMKAFKKEKVLNEHEDECTENVGVTVEGDLHNKSESTKLNDSMRQIVADFIKQLPPSSENFLVRVEPITECPMCYFQFNYQHFIFSTKTGAYTTNCQCGLTIYILFEESLHLLKEYHSSSVSSDASSSFTNVKSLDSEFETSSPVITENVKDFIEYRGRRLNKRKNRTKFFILHDSDDESIDYQDDSDDNYVPYRL